MVLYRGDLIVGRVAPVLFEVQIMVLPKDEECQFLSPRSYYSGGVIMTHVISEGVVRELVNLPRNGRRGALVLGVLNIW